MARGRQLVGLLCAAAGAATVSFVAPRLVATQAPSPRSDITARAASEFEYGELPPRVTVDEQEGSSFWKWFASGLLAGIIAASAAAAPAQAVLQEVTPSFVPNKSDRLFDGRPLGKAAGGYGNPWEPSWDGYAVKCKDSKKFHKLAKEKVSKIEKRLSTIAPGGLIYTWFTDIKERSIKMETSLGERWCDKDSGQPLVLPVITNERGSVVAPALIFLYIAGWIGWAARSYLQRTQCAEKELLIDIPLASMCMLSGFSWPVTAWQEIVDGKMTARDEDIILTGQAVP